VLTHHPGITVFEFTPRNDGIAYAHESCKTGLLRGLRSAQ
jgi:hypothetical protein